MRRRHDLAAHISARVKWGRALVWWLLLLVLRIGGWRDVAIRVLLFRLRVPMRWKSSKGVRLVRLWRVDLPLWWRTARSRRLGGIRVEVLRPRPGRWSSTLAVMLVVMWVLPVARPPALMGVFPSMRGWLWMCCCCRRCKVHGCGFGFDSLLLPLVLIVLVDEVACCYQLEAAEDDHDDGGGVGRG